MSDSDSDPELEEIRREKLEELAERTAAPEVPDSPVHLEAADEYDDVVGRYDVVLVDFYADWCGPCKMLEPAVETIAAETDAAVLKVDVDEHQGLAGRMTVRGVPTLVLYADGEEVRQLVGVQSADDLRALVGQYT